MGKIRRLVLNWARGGEKCEEFRNNRIQSDACSPLSPA